jgi:hypothetical protein
MERDGKGTDLGNVIRIDDERVRDHFGRIVRGTVEETLNAMLEAEADRLCNAERYERTQARRDQRFGSYERKLQTKAGQVTLAQCPTSTRRPTARSRPGGTSRSTASSRMSISTASCSSARGQAKCTRPVRAALRTA